MHRKPFLLEWFLFVLICAGAIWHASYYWGYSIDDSAISYRFAHNLASGHGMVFNRGMPPSEGYTNFLWTILEVPAFWAGYDLVPYSKILGVLALLATMSGVFVLGRMLFTLRFLALVPCVLLASNPNVILWTVSGLEPLMFAAWLGWGSVFFYQAQKYQRRGYYLASAAAFSFLLLTRPDGLLFWGVMAAFALLIIWLHGSARWILTWFGAIFAVAALYHGWRYVYFGSLVPNTFLVKGSGGELSRQLGMDNLKRLMAMGDNLFFVGLAAIGALGSLGMWFWPKRHLKFGRAGLAALCSAEFMVVAYIFTATLLYGIYLSGIAWDGEVGLGRFYIHIIAWIYFLAACGLDTLFRDLPEAWAGGASVRPEGAHFSWVASLMGAVGFTVLVGMLVQREVRDGMVRYGGHRTVSAAVERVHRKVATYLVEHSRPGDTVIGQDMGFIPFFAENLIFIDSIGICDRTVASEIYAAGYNYYTRYLMAQDPAEFARIEKMDERIKDYLKSYQARWILFFADMPDNAAKQAEASAASLKVGRYDRFFTPYLVSNTYFHDLFRDPEVVADYEAVGSWMWNYKAYYVLYQRKQSP